MPEQIQALGETFTVAERIGLMPLMRFAKVAKGGADSADLDGLAAMYDLLQQCIAEQDWARFEEAADRTRAGDEELMDVVKRVFEVLSERPTQRPSVSSDGPTSVEPISTPVSSSPVLDRLAGRPDLQLMVLQAQEARAS